MGYFDPNTINQKVLALMEQHGADWKKPWVQKLDGLMPMNVAQRRNYSGINIFILLSAGYDSNYWSTYKGWQSLGAQVQKGQHGEHIILFRPVTIKDKDSEEERTVPMLRTFTVFNAAQVEGWTPPTEIRQTLYETQGSALVDDIFEKVGAVVNYGGNKACYWPHNDTIDMPLPEQFKDPVRFDGTRMHELGHWTGHNSRLDRPILNHFGDEEYAKEELVAEMYSLYMGAFLGLEIEPDTGHAKYLNNWMQAIKEDKWAFYRATKEAWKAMKWVLDHAGISFEPAVELAEPEMEAA